MSRRTILIGGAGAAAAVVVVVLLLLSGVLPGLRPSGPGGTVSPGSSRYAIDFAESGLRSGTNWSVTLAGLTSTSDSAHVGFLEPNGTYAYRITPPPGYRATPSSGNVTVDGQADHASVLFASLPTYAVNFSESGLPTSTQWTVTLNGTARSSTNSSILFASVNGTFAYSVSSIPSYTATPSSGSLTISGAAVTQPVTFSSGPNALYPITFSESGLPAGTPWSIDLNGGSSSTTGSTLGFREANGSYAYAVGAVSGYTASPDSGTVTISGAAATVAVVFAAAPPPSTESNVTFNETGLPSGTDWTVTLTVGASPYQSSVSTEGPWLVVALPNSTFAWSVSASTNLSLTPDPSSGTFSVSGSGLQIGISFSPPSPSLAYYPVNFTESGLPAGTYWTLFFNGTLLSSTSTTILTTATNGSYFYGASANGFATFWGFVLVAGGPASASFHFSPTYGILFQETGLGANTSWWVDVYGSSSVYGTAGTPIVVNESNGSYPFVVSTFGFFGQASYVASPAMGNVTVNGTNLTVSIRFTPVPQYHAYFSEAGLPSGAIWEVDVGPNFLDMIGTTDFGTGSTFSLPNGTYVWDAYELAPNSSYLPSALAGSFDVNGADVFINLTFAYAPRLHEVEFTESDVLYSPLPNPPTLSWNVSALGRSFGAIDGYVFLAVPNGSFSFSIVPPAGQAAIPRSGTVIVNDSGPFLFNQFPYFTNVSVVIDFIPGPAMAASPASGAYGPSFLGPRSVAAPPGGPTGAPVPWLSKVQDLL